MFRNVIEFPLITPQSAFFLFIEINANRQVINPILLTFKNYIYNARENKKLSLQRLIACINKVRNTGNMISSKDPLQGKNFSNK